MGIVSITPRIDYCQGNKWDVNLETIDDLHKPQLDQIGFQDQLTENMAAVTTIVDASINTYKSVGKVPAWLNYMSNVNQVFGNFALEDNEMYMVMPRRYDIEVTKNGHFKNYDIKDITTYIDPSKFNYMFAQTSLDSMNFWTQIAVDINKRSVMSSKIMPNL